MSNQFFFPEELACNPSINWDNGDASSFRNFLQKNPKFLQFLASRTPKIEGGSMEEMALSGATHAGYEQLFRALSNMASDNNADGKSPFIPGDEEEAP